jgi:diguanylate cyclase (GGDEF)-like protein
MIAQNDILGLIYIEFPGGKAAISDTKRLLAQSLAEQIALALANLKLRETLRHQSIRDPLTGLYNRRHLEESMQRELARAQRKQSPLAVVMLDVDHFKRFNDTFGHDAGDLVLQAMGRVLREQLRASDVPCRYGGEEFVLLLPDATFEATKQRAESLRLAVQALSINQNGQPLGPISISLGIAMYPQHGDTVENLIPAADAALYRAKRGGRNRLEIAA